jgi:hypothetical protein
MKHYEESKIIPTTPERLFGFIDDHARFSSHMSKSSWMMGGGKMEVSLDEGKGQKLGSHIKMGGKAFGISLFLDEVIIIYEPPYKKVWATVGEPKLLVIGSYKLGIEITPKDQASSLKVFIDYEMPARNKWLGGLFSDMYAKWCVRQMLEGAANEFRKH